MIGRITPLVQRWGYATWCRVASLHALGLVVSATTLGLVLGSLGFAFHLHQLPWIGVATGTLIVIAGLLDVGVLRFRIPEMMRQTPGHWTCLFGEEWGAFMWGLDLGQGWTVRIPFAAYYAVVGAALVSGSVIVGSLILGAYGLGKAVPLFVAGLQTERDRGSMVTNCILGRSRSQRVLAAVGLAIGAPLLLGFISL